MKLSLDYTQRLNLHALMGAQRVNVDDLRLFWRLQDMIQLTPEEKQAINYRTIQQNGRVEVQWDVIPEGPFKDYEFAPDEFQRLGKMVREWQPGFLIGADRQWMEPLMAQLDGVTGPVNGAIDKKEMGLGMALPRGR